MKLRIRVILTLVLALLLSGCQKRAEPVQPEMTEPTVTYDWMAGESPVSDERVGVFRSSVTATHHAVSPRGAYFIGANELRDSYILYVDHGSDQVIKLCGRVDCTHTTSDCNAYFYRGTHLSYYDGYLYVVAGDVERYMYRMDSDGSNRVTIMDFQEVAREHGGEFIGSVTISKGICLLRVCKHVLEDGRYVQEWVKTLIYKLDGSLGDPQPVEIGASVLYHCGDVFCAVSAAAEDGSENTYDWNPETGELKYLTKYPGVPGYFGEQNAYYFRDGAMYCLNYATGEETAVFETDLEGRYYAFCFSDCIVLASWKYGKNTDNTLYFYNWEFELVGTIVIPNERLQSPQSMLISETAERIILSNKGDGPPLYYIDKSELGTEELRIHHFDLPEL
ncbi:MAG: hypothetical protein IJV82_03510 [Oscillospiraceae bacterium]|nr:hypothetical protein [Oscillospiraceae bacterium]